MKPDALPSRVSVQATVPPEAPPPSRWKRLVARFMNAQAALRIHFANGLYIPLLLQQYKARGDIPPHAFDRTLESPVAAGPSTTLSLSSSKQVDGVAHGVESRRSPDRATAAAIASAIESVSQTMRPPLERVQGALNQTVEPFDSVLARGIAAGDPGARRWVRRGVEMYADVGATDDDLKAVLASLPPEARPPLAAVQAFLSRPATSGSLEFETCAGVVTRLSGLPWSEQVRARIAHWVERYLDPSVAWASPYRTQPPFAAWLAETRLDCSDTVLGLRGAQVQLENLPTQPDGVIEMVLRQLKVPEALRVRYFETLLTEAVAALPPLRLLQSNHAFALRPKEFLTHLLAVRLAWELILFREFAMQGAELAWRRALSAARKLQDAPRGTGTLDIGVVVGAAAEHARYRRIASALSRTMAGEPESESESNAAPDCANLRDDRAMPAAVFVAPSQAHNVSAASGLRVSVYDAASDRDFSALERLILGEVLHSDAGVDNTWEQRPALFIAAPVTAINRVIEAHPEVRGLVDNGWVNLFAVYDQGAVIVQYDGDLHWAPATVQDVA